MFFYIVLFKCIYSYLFCLYGLVPPSDNSIAASNNNNNNNNNNTCR